VVKGEITVETLDGASRTYRWDDTDVSKGYIYLYWIVADRAEQRIALASNVVDVTWEAPSGKITSFDGAVDPRSGVRDRLAVSRGLAHVMSISRPSLSAIHAAIFAARSGSV
jgi:hypothetical protein